MTGPGSRGRGAGWDFVHVAVDDAARLIGVRDEAEISWTKTHARHVVFADCAPADDEIAAVENDLPAAMRKLLKALTEAGYRRIGMVGGLDHDRQSRVKAREKRMQAYVDRVQARGQYDADICQAGWNTEASG
jgi:LacI family transcriptional regulator